MNTLTDLHKQLLIFVENNEKIIEDTTIIQQFGVTLWLDLWREGLVITSPKGTAYLTDKGREVVKNVKLVEERI